MAARLDRIDLKILRLLQNNGRLSNAELAVRGARSAPPPATAAPSACLRTASSRPCGRMVAPEEGGEGPLIMVGVVLDRSTPESFATFERAIARLKFVLDCHLVAGDFDYFLKIRVGDMAGLQPHPWRAVDRVARRAPDPHLSS